MPASIIMVRGVGQKMSTTLPARARSQARIEKRG